MDTEKDASYFTNQQQYLILSYSCVCVCVSFFFFLLTDLGIFCACSYVNGRWNLVVMNSITSAISRRHVYGKQSERKRRNLLITS